MRSYAQWYSGLALAGLWSPTTARDDRRLKLPAYARAGVGVVWLACPEQRLLEIYRTTPDGLPALALTLAGDEAGVMPPVEHEIAVATWWAVEATSRAKE